MKNRKSDMIFMNIPEELKKLIKDKDASEITPGNNDHIYDTLQKAIINDRQDIKEKELAETVIHALDKNTFLNRKNIDMLGDLMKPGNAGLLLDGLKLCAACAGSAIIHTKPEKMSKEMDQMFCQIQKGMKDQQDGSGQSVFRKLLSGYTSKDWIISGDDIDVQGGKYSYKLILRANGTLSFNHDLEVSYQGITGSYQLNYDKNENGNDMMIMMGKAENIIVASPALEKLSDKSKNWIHSHISGDTYSYQLILRAKEGISFNNKLRFFFNSDPHGYSMNYAYDILTDKQTLKINGITDEDRLNQVI